ncbi:MAG: MupA/Atu3671 family FMN-dependent luciferase-like monooxygenase [Acidobacteriota bacterium]
MRAPLFRHVFELLAGNEQLRPDAVAIVAAGRSPTTYRSLLANALGLADRLKELGVGRADRVAVVLPNGPEMATAFLAVSMAGVCAPLNPGYRANEFRFLLPDLGARALIVSAGDETSPARLAARELAIPIFEARPAVDSGAGGFTLTGDSTGPPASPGSPDADDLALVLYTSGMTSRPKAVPLSHRRICISAHNIAVALELTPGDRCLNVMPLFHAHGLIIALLSSLTAGGSVVCSGGFSAEDFFASVRDARPTWYTAAPTIHHAVVESAPEYRGILRGHGVRFIRSSAAFLPANVKAGLEREFACPVIEAYGMTECTQITSNPRTPDGRREGSVGVPAGPTVAVLDETGRVLPPGDAGEVVVRGPAVVTGYLSNPAADQSAFFDGWFRTGDQGVLSADGYLTLTGRLKEIINCGGEKLSPYEVDEVLMDHPAVSQAVAFGVAHPTLGEDVAAAVVLRGGAVATETELRDFAATRLADYKVPRQILIVAEIPKSATGKLRRVGLAEALGLAAPAEGRSAAAAPAPAPEESVERRLAKIWAELLKLDSVDMNANFFRLGGDSILASRLVARVRKEFRVELPLRSLFATPTVAELSSTIERSKSQPAPPTAPARERSRPAEPPSPEPEGFPTPASFPSVSSPAAVPAAEALSSSPVGERVHFSLIFFSADGSTASSDKYRLVLEASQFADRHGYTAVWTPERHFHPFGGLYPNPAVLGAAIAATTNRVQIRAASVVLPLQNPIRVAEEWALVDNLSRGRVAVSFASGWHVNDFALWPSTFENRKKVMFERLRIVRDLWAGKPFMTRNGAGIEIPVTSYPRPIQPTLPFWLSCQSDETFAMAGELGGNVITSMFLMSVEELAGKIAVYRQARARGGHDPATGQVTVSLHTFLAEDAATVREKVGGAYLDYLLVNLGLQADRVRAAGDEFEPSDADKEFLTRQASERLFNERGLVGTVAACAARVATLTAIGVDEIACLIDFGIDFDSVMASLYQLNRLKDLCAVRSASTPAISG